MTDLNWWDVPVDDTGPTVATPGMADLSPSDFLAQAADDLALAFIQHERHRGAATVQTVLDTLVREAKDLVRGLEAGHDLPPARVHALLHRLDRLEREDYEPQTWRHLAQAEDAVLRAHRAMLAAGDGS